MQTYLTPKFYLHLVLASLLVAFSQLSLASLEPIGRVLIATQGVTAQQPQGEVRNLGRKSVIYLGDTLTTPEGGKAQIRLNDGELISLTPATQLILEDFNYDPQASNNTSVKNLVTGGLRSISGVVGGEGYQVKTRAGTIGIRGTAYEAYSQQGNNLYVRMQRGDVSVKNSRGEVLVGVNQPLAAARITSPNAKPEAISFSALPKFFNQSFNAEATLSLAEEDNSDAPVTASNEEEATQLEETALAEADSTTGQVELSGEAPPPANSNTSLLVAAVTSDTNLQIDDAAIDAKTNEADNREIATNPNLDNEADLGEGNIEVEPPEPNEPPQVVEPTMELGGYEANYDYEKIEVDINLLNTSETHFADLKQQNNGELAIDAVPELFSDAFLAAENLTEGLNAYTEYKFDDGSNIFFGYTFNLDIEKEELTLTNFALTEHLLAQANLPAINESYRFNLLDTSLMADGPGLKQESFLEVNFISNTIYAELHEVETFNNSVPYTGSGSFSEFYSNAGIKLNIANNPAAQGGLVGQFVGTNNNISSALTYYVFNMEGDDLPYQAGLAIFNKDDVLPPKNFQGFVLQEELNLIPDANDFSIFKESLSELYSGGYFSNVSVEDVGNTPSFTFQVNNATALFPTTGGMFIGAVDSDITTNNLEAVNFQGLLSTGVDNYIKDAVLAEKTDFSIYEVFALDDAQIYYGYNFKTEQEPGSDMLDLTASNFIFSQQALSLSELDNLVLAQINESFTYNLATSSSVLETGMSSQKGLESGQLAVNFFAKSIDVQLEARFETNVTNFTGEGNLTQFYNEGISLQDQGATGSDTGKIAGQFVGRNASGAITVYELGEVMNDYQAGTAIFAR